MFAKPAKLVRSLVNLDIVPTSNQLLKSWSVSGRTYDYVPDYPELFNVSFRERVLKRVKEVRKVSGAGKCRVEDQFICINHMLGPIADFFKYSSVGTGHRSYFFLQTQEQFDAMWNVCKLILYYAKMDVDSPAEREHIIMEQQDFDQLSAAGDSTFVDIGRANIITFIVRSKVFDRVLPIAWGLKVDDDHIGYTRFYVYLFMDPVLNEGELKDFNVECLPGTFFHRHDFCKKYYKGLCIAIGILRDIALLKHIKQSGDLLHILLNMDKDQMDSYEEQGKKICESICIGCKIHLIRSRWRISNISTVIPPSSRSAWFALNDQLDQQVNPDDFGKVIKLIISRFPKTAKYFSWWTSREVIKRAWPLLNGRTPEVIKCIKHHQQDIECMHSDLKRVNFGLSRANNVEEVITALYGYTNGIYRAEKAAAIGYTVHRPQRHRVQRYGGISRYFYNLVNQLSDGRGLDKAVHFRGDLYKNILLGADVKRSRGAPNKRVCHKFKMKDIQIINTHSPSLDQLNVLSIICPMAKQDELQCGISACFGGLTMEQNKSNLISFGEYVASNKESIAKGEHKWDEDQLEQFASCMEKLNNRRNSKSFALSASNKLASRNEPTQNIGSEHIEHILSTSGTSIFVMESPKSMMEGILFPDFAGYCSPLYVALEKGKPVFIICNTTETGSHWRTFMLWPSNNERVFICLSCDSLYSWAAKQLQEQTMRVTKEIVNLITLGYGLDTKQNIRSLLCPSIESLSNAINQFDISSGAWTSTLHSNLNQILREPYRPEWRRRCIELEVVLDESLLDEAMAEFLRDVYVPNDHDNDTDFKTSELNEILGGGMSDGMREWLENITLHRVHAVLRSQIGQPDALKRVIDETLDKKDIAKRSLDIILKTITNITSNKVDLNQQSAITECRTNLDSIVHAVRCTCYTKGMQDMLFMLQ